MPVGNKHTILFTVRYFSLAFLEISFSPHIFYSDFLSFKIIFKKLYLQMMTVVMEVMN